VSGASISPMSERPYMKPGTVVKARRFGIEIDGHVSASSGSTFTVTEDGEGCHVWWDMTFDDVTIIEESTRDW